MSQNHHNSLIHSSHLIQKNAAVGVFELHFQLKGCRILRFHLNGLEITDLLDELHQWNKHNNWSPDLCIQSWKCEKPVILAALYLCLLLFSFLLQLDQFLQHATEISDAILDANALIVFLLSTQQQFPYRVVNVTLLFLNFFASTLRRL